MALREPNAIALKTLSKLVDFNPEGDYHLIMKITRGGYCSYFFTG